MGILPWILEVSKTFPNVVTYTEKNTNQIQESAGCRKGLPSLPLLAADAG